MQAWGYQHLCKSQKLEPTGWSSGYNQTIDLLFIFFVALKFSFFFFAVLNINNSCAKVD
jgi:hypothetical protein